MIADKAPAYLCISLEMRRGGNTGRRRAEHRNLLQLRSLTTKCKIWVHNFYVLATCETSVNIDGRVSEN